MPKQSIFRPLKGSFRFRCHKEISCFNKCCAKLRLILTPYDILRMKNRLGLSSEAFLEKYTETVIEKQSRFPMVKLRMEQGGGACPFVTGEGCSIYRDRPGACRLYPVGRASTKVEGEDDAREKFFLVRESHCLGFEEDMSWTVEEWLAHEGVKEYNAMNDEWMEIITSSKRFGSGDNTRKFQMFFMASYNLDSFRNFVFESRFLDLFRVDEKLREDLRSDDVALMKFGFTWLRFSLFGDKTLEVKLSDQR